MKTILTFIAIAALTGNLAATEIEPSPSHDVASTNGKFKLHVDAESETHKISGAFKSWRSGWEFHHEVSNHSFFVSDDGEAAAVVHWSWCQVDDLDKAAVVIYGRKGAKRIYTYNELSKPRKPKPGTVGPIGDFWRIWRDDATINGNLLTIAVEGEKPRIIDLKNPQPVAPDSTKKKAEESGR